MAKSNARKAAEAAAKAAAQAAASAAQAAGKTAEERSAIAAQAAADAAKIDPEQLVEARVLCDCTWGKADQVVQLRLADLEQALDQGMVDDHPDAVAYAKSIRGQ